MLSDAPACTQTALAASWGALASRPRSWLPAPWRLGLLAFLIVLFGLGARDVLRMYLAVPQLADFGLYRVAGSRPATSRGATRSRRLFPQLRQNPLATSGSLKPERRWSPRTRSPCTTPTWPRS